jgi:hypothetical protein
MNKPITEESIKKVCDTFLSVATLLQWDAEQKAALKEVIRIVEERQTLLKCLDNQKAMITELRLSYQNAVTMIHSCNEMLRLKDELYKNKG